MKIVNLDKFRRKLQVTLDGVTYDVRGTTFEEFLSDVEQDDAQSTVKKFEYQVKRLTNMTSIPEETLRKQEMTVLTALMQVCQGIDPEEVEDEAEAGAEGNVG